MRKGSAEPGWAFLFVARAKSQSVPPPLGDGSNALVSPQRKMPPAPVRGSVSDCYTPSILGGPEKNVRYAVFEEAATEASLGVQQIDSQLEQLNLQMDQLRGRRDLLETLSRQLLALVAEVTPAAAVSQPVDEQPVAEEEPVKAELPLPESEPVPVLAGIEPPPPGWFSRRYTSGIRNSGVFSRR